MRSSRCHHSSREPSNSKRRVLPKQLRVHDARHTSVSLLVNQGIPTTSVMEHVGHSSITSTINRYAHLYPDARIEATDALDRAIDSARNHDESRIACGQDALGCGAWNGG